MDKALLRGIKVVTYLAPGATTEEANEGMRLLGAVDWVRQGDLIAFIVANPIQKNIHDVYHLLDAEECRIGNEDCARALLKDDWPQPLRLIQVQFKPKKKN